MPFVSDLLLQRFLLKGGKYFERAVITGAQAITLDGFPSENAKFAKCAECNTLIGPHEVFLKWGIKAGSLEAMIAANVPVIPGSMMSLQLLKKE